MKRIASIMLLSLFLFLSACSGQTVDNAEENAADYAYASIYSVSTYGLIYPNGYTGLLTCFDWALDEEIPMCSMPNCLHQSADCPAYFEWYSDLCGLAAYQNQLYVIQYDRDTYCWNVKRMELDGTNQTVLYTLKSDRALITPQKAVFYTNNSMFLSLEYYDYFTEEVSVQSVRIDLSTGMLTELTGQVSLSDEDPEVERLQNQEIVAVTEEYAVLKQSWLSAGALGEDDYYEQFGINGDYSTYTAALTDTRYSVVSYDGRTTREVFRTEFGHAYQLSRSNIFLLNGELVISDNTALYTVSLETGKKTLLHNFKAPLNLIGLVDDKLFCTVNIGTDGVSNWVRVYYDCETGEVVDTPCTFGTPKASVGNRIVGICGDGIFWCSKDDFYANKSDGVHLIGLF